MSLGTGNQAASDISEVEASLVFLRMLEGLNLKATYFLTGRLLEEEWDQAKPLCESPNLEIGGHTYDCFEPSLLHRISKKLLGSYNGPRWYERRDVRRTCALIEARTGRACRSWRNHMYMHGPNTNEILLESGIQICSDGTDREGRGPVLDQGGLSQFPLNVIPDHEHLYHAERTPAWVARWKARYQWSDSFGSESYFIEEWTDLVLEQLQRNENRGAISCLLLHPITMYLCDGFRACRKILDYISTRETCHLGELVSERTLRRDLEAAA
jgi:hypothetical protein